MLKWLRSIGVVPWLLLGWLVCLLCLDLVPLASGAIMTAFVYMAACCLGLAGSFYVGVKLLLAVLPEHERKYTEGCEKYCLPERYGRLDNGVRSIECIMQCMGNTILGDSTFFMFQNICVKDTALAISIDKSILSNFTL